MKIWHFSGTNQLCAVTLLPSINFRRYWRMYIAACLARERGRVSVRAALGDWAKRETERMVAVGAAMHQMHCWC